MMLVIEKTLLVELEFSTQNNYNRKKKNVN